MYKRIVSFLFLALCTGAMLHFASTSTRMIFAKEFAPGAKKTDVEKTDAQKLNELLEKIFTVPDGTAAEILNYHQTLLTKLNQDVPLEIDRETKNQIVQNIYLTTIQIADKALEKKPTTEQEKKAYTLKLRALSQLARDNTAKKEEYLQFAQLVSSKKELGQLAQSVKSVPLTLEMEALENSTDFLTDAKNFRTKLINQVKKDPSFDSAILLEFLDFIYFNAPEEQTLSFLKETANLIRPVLRVRNPQLLQNVDTTVNNATFTYGLVGKQFRFEGTDITGKKINLDDFRGKVVLVDFWATWCGPCVAEIPKMSKLYEQYKSCGFEIVGYSVDEDVDDLREFVKNEDMPWVTLSKKMSTQKFQEDFTATYRIRAYPTMFLVDRDGKVMSVRAQGEALEKQLHDMFGEPSM